MAKRNDKTKAVMLFVSIVALVGVLGVIVAYNGYFNMEGITSMGVNDLTNPVCGNSICEDGEPDSCPPCRNEDPPCDLLCVTGSCSQDCGGEVYVALDEGAQASGKDYVGLYRPSENKFILLKEEGSELIEVYASIDTGDMPIAGDWDNDGIDEIGFYREGYMISPDVLRKPSSKWFLKGVNDGSNVLAANFLKCRGGDKPIAGDWDGDGTDTIGCFRNNVVDSSPNGKHLFFLVDKNENVKSSASPAFGIPGSKDDIAIAGDWDGDGKDGIGVFNPGTGKILLSNSIANDMPAASTITFGSNGDKLVAGDWDNDSKDSIGVYRPSEGKFYLKNKNDDSETGITGIPFGVTGDMPIAGDWNNDGKDSIGVYRPSEGKFYLKYENTDTKDGYNETFNYSVGDFPVVGDWDNDGIDEIGLYRESPYKLIGIPTSKWYFKSTNVGGSADLEFSKCSYGDLPFIGDWNGDGMDTIGCFRRDKHRFYLLKRNANINSFRSIEKIGGSSGSSSDIALVGDWDGNGKDSIGTYNPGAREFILTNSIDKSPSEDIKATFGIAGDLPIVGDWNNDGKDSIGVYRPSEGKFYLSNSNKEPNEDMVITAGKQGDLPIKGRFFTSSKTCDDNCGDGTCQENTNCSGSDDDCSCTENTYNCPRDCGKSCSSPSGYEGEFSCDGGVIKKCDKGKWVKKRECGRYAHETGKCSGIENIYFSTGGLCERGRKPR